MQEITEGHDRIIFQVEIAVPSAEAEGLVKALTGDDNDVILAAEHAIRERLGEDDIDSEVELLVPSEDAVKDRLRTFGQNRAWQ